MSDLNTTQVTPLFSNRFYDILKYVALVLLPAFSALYFGLGQIWGLPKVEEIVGTVAVLDTFLGLLVRKSNQTYKNSDSRFAGQINVVEDEGTKLYSLNVDGDPAEVLEKNKEVTFKVNKDETVDPLEDLGEHGKL